MTKRKKTFTELDFLEIKNQLKTYLREQDKFKDYDFEGSNMAVLLDVLAYNTYQNNFYTNMSISEMFLDSAQKENSVISHAKELNYLPRSKKSSKAIVDIAIKDENTSDNALFIPKNTRFTSDHQGLTYTFYTNEDYIARRQTSTDIFKANCVEIFEGKLIDEIFTLHESSPIITISNEDVDVNSIEVIVDYDFPLPDTAEEFKYTKDIFGIDQNDPVFYLQKGFDNQYEIYFGRNKFGRQPTANEDIRVSYRITNGDEANGIKSFKTSFKPNVTVKTRTKSFGGAERESVSDIKFFAPKSIQIQERAVTENDYSVLLKQQFTEILDVSVYGGEELDPPKFGKVAISVNVDGGLSDTARNEYLNFLSTKTPISIQPLIIQPRFMYVRGHIDIFYDPRKTTKTEDSLEKDIRDVIKQYGKDNLMKFGSTFRTSRLTNLIDDLDDSILSSTMKTYPFIEYSPDLNIKDTPTFSFKTELIRPFPLRKTENTDRNEFNLYNPSIFSSKFNFKGTQSYLRDDGRGNVAIISAEGSSVEMIKPNSGTVDYEEGKVRLIEFVVREFEGNSIAIIADTKQKDIQAPKDKVLNLRDSDMEIKLHKQKR